MRIEEKDGQISIADFDEVLAYKIACKIEKDGIGVYNYLTRRVEEGSLKDMFAFLSQQEEEHYKYFSKRLEGLTHKNVEKNAKYDQLINLMDLKIFPPYQEIVKIADSTDNEKDLLDMAVDIETKSVSFYAACLENESSSDLKKELEHIIEEETHHKELLEEASKQN